MLQTELSFSLPPQALEDGDKNEQDQKDSQKGKIERTVTIGESIEASGSVDLSIKTSVMRLINEEADEEGEGLTIPNDDVDHKGEPVSPPMYLAAGFGIDAFDVDGFGGACFDMNSINLDDDGGAGGGDSDEERYKRLVDEYPCHPLFLRNYAQLLQSKGDLNGAEEYYHRATLVDPDDGEILSQYATLLWEFHHDQDKALSYFERAVQVSPADSNIHAAYARFLWEMNDEEDEDKTEEESRPAGEADEHTDTNAKQDFDLEDYYRKMIEQNPNNPLVLRNYARFLYKEKGDFQGAEEYYTRSIVADPDDGEIMLEYATLVWELHRNHDKALACFEQAVQVTPENSDVLAAYARFLWEAVEEEEDSTRQDQTNLALSREAATNAKA